MWFIEGLGTGVVVYRRTRHEGQELWFIEGLGTGVVVYRTRHEGQELWFIEGRQELWFKR